MLLVNCSAEFSENIETLESTSLLHAMSVVFVTSDVGQPMRKVFGFDYISILRKEYA